MATRAEVKEEILDLVIATLIDDYPTSGTASGDPTFETDFYKKYIDPNSGEITSSPSGGIDLSTVIYQQDYQDFENSFTADIETIADCLCHPGEITDNVCSDPNGYIPLTCDDNDDDCNPACPEGNCTTWSSDNSIYQCVCVDGTADECGTICSEGSDVTCDGYEACEYIEVSLDGGTNFRITWDLQGFTGCSTYDMYITEFVFVYLSQLLKFTKTSTTIDPNQAQEILDTTIFELLPQGLTRQQRINKFFAEFQNLIGDPPPYSFDIDGDAVPDTWQYDIEDEQNNYFDSNSVINNPAEGNITRLERHAQGDTNNEDKTLESLRNIINTHLTDIDKKIDPEISDERPEYEDVSPGYLKIRNLNQSIIIRSQEGQDVGLMGPDPENPKWLEDGFTVTMWVKFLDKKRGGTLFNFGNPFRENNPQGFVLETFSLHKDGIVRTDDEFDDEPIEYTWGEWINCKTYHPPEGDNPYALYPEYCTEDEGHPLEYGTTFSEHHNYFKDSDWERFVRLVVREKPTDGLPHYPKGALRDSHVGVTTSKEGYLARRIDSTADPKPIDDPSVNWEDGWGGTIPTAPLWALGDASNEGFTCDRLNDVGHCGWYSVKLLQHTRIPSDPGEWYFIVANYNPDIDEDNVLCNSYDTSDGGCYYNSVGDAATEACDCNPGDDGSCAAAGGGGKNCSPNALTSLVYNSDYWRWHIDPVGANAGDKQTSTNQWLNLNDPMGKYTHNSGRGARCKVEIISKSELVRALGYKP